MMGVRRALVDLAKDRNRVAGISTKHEGGLILDGRLEREFGTRKYADSHRTILRRGGSSCAGAEVVRHGRRLWVSFGVTTNPTAEWISRQIIEAFPWDSLALREIQTTVAILSTLCSTKRAARRGPPAAPPPQMAAVLSQDGGGPLAVLEPPPLQHCPGVRCDVRAHIGRKTE